MLDQFISNKIVLIQSEPITRVMGFITQIFGPYIIIILSFFIFLILFRKKNYFKAKILAFSISSAIILDQILKFVLRRPRPLNMLINEGGFSFPSGHATLAAVFFGMIIFLFKDKIKNNFLKLNFIILNISFILLIGFTRIYLNVHWFTDVLGGFLLGFFCILCSVYICKKFKFQWKLPIVFKR